MFIRALFVCATGIFAFCPQVEAIVASNNGLESVTPIVFGDKGEKFEIVDGDTIWLGIHQIRLHGIDALEPKQDCLKGGQRFPCNEATVNFLESLIERSKLRCEVHIGKLRKPLLRYGRYIATCYSGDTEINQAMVESGWALAAHTKNGDRYRDAEQAARELKLGIHELQFEPPWEYRKGSRKRECKCSKSLDTGSNSESPK